MVKPLFFTLSLVLLFGCGTIGSRRSIIAVDSTPRGATVTGSNGESLGVTPFFMQKEKQLLERFNFSYEDQKKSEYYNCSINWSESVLPNLIPSAFFPVGMAVTGGFLLTDWATGDIYRCHNPLTLTFSATSVAPASTPRLLVLPPPLDDYLLARNLAEKVIHSEKIEGKMVKWGRAEEVLEYFGINSKRSADIKSIPREHWHEVAYQTKATTLLYFEVQETEIVPVLMDLITFQTKKLNPVVYKHESSFSSYAASLFSFFPNALTFSYMSGIAGTTVDDPSDDHVTKHPDALPKVLSWWGAENISNPRLFSPWDIELQFSPLIAFPAFRYQRDEYWINGQRYYFGYEGALTFHSPFGAFRFGCGLGPSFSQYEDSTGASGQAFHWLTNSVSASYYGFVTERLYFKISINAYKFKSQEYQGKVDDLTVSMVTLGYYIPHLKWKLRQITPF